MVWSASLDVRPSALPMLLSLAHPSQFARSQKLPFCLFSHLSLFLSTDVTTRDAVCNKKTRECRVNVLKPLVILRRGSVAFALHIRKTRESTNLSLRMHRTMWVVLRTYKGSPFFSKKLRNWRMMRCARMISTHACFNGSWALPVMVLFIEIVSVVPFSGSGWGCCISFCGEGVV